MFGGVMLIDCIRFFNLGVFFFQAEDGIRDLVRSRGLGDVYKRQFYCKTVDFIFLIYCLFGRFPAKKRGQAIRF